VRTTEYLPNQQTLGMSTVRFYSGAFQNSTSSQIQTDMHMEDLRLGARGTEGPPPLFARLADPTAASHRPAGCHKRKGQHRAWLQNAGETKSTGRSHRTRPGWVYFFKTTVVQGATPEGLQPALLGLGRHTAPRTGRDTREGDLDKLGDGLAPGQQGARVNSSRGADDP
jgi:hypothetical protein